MQQFDWSEVALAGVSYDPSRQQAKWCWAKDGSMVSRLGCDRLISPSGRHDVVSFFNNLLTHSRCSAVYRGVRVVENIR
ncbi:uncharacterized protein BDR25DRAFT_77642 [Lindgomyces ingoldianus]|uniref:Uncharacterized protein n=1 Tax=Lindgomyces ingoldianus TaxID=673940 RepID=A0ACB6QHD8_9PLEO|nr:uncharacterized protein BDR25DRAFT_77642 [Lindgomyces ingoldianus]KAF2466344.1 hypothetical protein BDR25DRAFT_77642 [Lindgomyces ingoldianus]